MSSQKKLVQRKRLIWHFTADVHAQVVATNKYYALLHEPLCRI